MPSAVPSAAPAVAIDASLKDAAPTLSLADDLAARTGAAEAVFGPHARSRVIGDLFLFAGPPQLGSLFDQGAALLARALPALYDGRFTRHPNAAVTILLFGSGPAYNTYVTAYYGAEATRNFGVYHSESREIVADGSGGANFLPTLTHEIVHPILNADFPDAPLWFKEAVASLYEAPAFSADGGIHGERRNWRHARLQAALASKKERDLVTLDKLFSMDGLEFVAWQPDGTSAEPVRLLHLAMARAFAAWLDGQGKLWPFYHAWRDGFPTDPKGDRAFLAVMGASVAEANAGWLASLR